MYNCGGYISGGGVIWYIYIYIYYIYIYEDKNILVMWGFDINELAHGGASAVARSKQCRQGCVFE